MIAAVSSWDGGGALDPAHSFFAHRASDLTIVVLSTPPGYVHWPHEHGMWKVARTLVGDEDNVVFERTGAGGLRSVDAFRLGQDEVTVFAADAIHSAANPGELPSLVLYVYGGDPYADSIAVSEWSLSLDDEHPLDHQAAAARRRAFCPPF